MVSQNLQHYKFQARPELANIIDDTITYSVLCQILAYQCTDIFTNGKSIVICYSNTPYPVWVWCKTPFDKQDIATIAHTLKTHYLEKGPCKFIISEDLLIELAKVDDAFGGLITRMQLLSHELTEINSIKRKCDGQMQKATLEQVDKLALLYKDASYEMEGHDFSIEHCKNVVVNFVQNDNLYVWMDHGNQIVATVGTTVSDKVARIGFVYTLPNERRKGYALNLVHGFSQLLMDNGFKPILYTNGDYVASNECYKKIGYKQIGKLVEVEHE